jgi:hypothetical protein
MTIKLGDTARDTITGFEGVVVAETQWLHGCRRLTLQPKGLHEGKPIETSTFDEPQCVLVETDNPKRDISTGGPRPEPRRQGDAR